MYKKLMALLMTGMFVVSAAACGADSAANTESGSTEDVVTQTADADQTTITGQVTEINGDTITLALGTFNMPSGAAMPDGIVPENGHPDNGGTPVSPDASNAQSDDAPDASARATPNMPDGDMPAQGQPGGDITDGAKGPDGEGAPGFSGGPEGGGFGFNATGETQTITVTSSTVITISSGGDETSGTLSDIAVNDLLTVTLNGTTVSDIVVSRFSGGMNGAVPDDSTFSGDLSDNESSASSDVGSSAA